MTPGNVEPTIAAGGMLAPMGAANGAIAPGSTHIGESDPDDRELLLRAVEGSRLAAEEASRASHAVIQLRSIIGEPPSVEDLAIAASATASAAQMAAWEQAHGMRGQLALLYAQARSDAARTRRLMTLVGALVVLGEPLLRALLAMRGAP